MNCKFLLPVLAAVSLVACVKNDTPFVNEDASTFTEIGSIVAGEGGTAEITAFDPKTKKLFSVSNSPTSTQVNIFDLSNPSAPMAAGSINMGAYGRVAHSVSVSNGKLAVSIEATVKTDPGKVVVFNIADNSVVKQITVGAYPDMLTYTPDGNYILTANEGEPNVTYTIDPEGTVSIISVNDNYSVTTVGFSGFASQQAALRAKGLRVYGPGASFGQDMEPEYIAVSGDSKTAWVTLQENNAIAKINIPAKVATAILPMGFKEFNVDMNAVDPSDRDGGIFLNRWGVKGMYQPDGIALYEYKGSPYLFTANEGDSRDYAGFSEVARVGTLSLDPVAFPDVTLKQDARAGRLNVTKTMGDLDNDGDYDQLYAFGSRSFSVWNGNNGDLLFDSKNQLEQKAIEAGLYDDLRSDDKGVEPEVVTIGKVGNAPIAFVGLERANAVAIYNISDPVNPKFLKLLSGVVGPESVTFIPAAQSPAGKSLLVVSSEVNSLIKV
ncbi:MAG TPA: choice-of-anchor I family protein, partial [Chitinophagaceae bacterium]|nr:choice-of-anchor I family protein [Chitinophagaceae bacterium]